MPSLTIVTLAPATTAPDESVTVPRMVPLTDCASAAGAASPTISSAQQQSRSAKLPACFIYLLLRDDPMVDWRPHELMQQRTLVIGRARFGAATMERLLPIQA